jgi:ATP-dependent Clp protease protease subunit
MKPNFQGFRAMSQGKTLQLFVYGPIGESWDGDGITAQQVAKSLQDAGPVDQIEIRVNSPGGLCFDALALVSLLRSQRAKKTVYVDGLAASSASVVMCAGDEIFCASNGLVMVHSPWSLCAGNAEEMRVEADRLDKVRDSITTTYFEQTRKVGARTSKAELEAMMERETWLNAAEALEVGLIDKITEAQQATASWDLSRFGYRNGPPRLTTQPPAANSATRAKVSLMTMAARRY